MLESLGKESGLINELHWRDFYMNTAHNFPEVLNGQIEKKNKSLKIKYDNIKWENNMKLFEHWKTATTGFPLIDASMRQLVQSGFVHNRMRMVSGSFVVKILLIDWRYAEKFYASHLVDYDTMVNNLSWQWVAGSGNDAQPYFRYFNTWTQSKKYDKNAEYIKKWIPELKEVPAIDLHNWFKKEIHEKWLNNGIKYYKPIVDHSEQRIKSLKIYKDGLN
jgi:deoxyribodipyrimidine photo-lyase